MSYLIGLYVYYHGNNLAAFGIVKGSQEIENQNQGLNTTYEDLKYSNVISQHDLDIIRSQEQVRQENNYEEMMRRAILQSQQDSMRLQQKGLIRNRMLESTPDELIDDMYYETGNIDMGFFDELNGF